MTRLVSLPTNVYANPVGIDIPKLAESGIWNDWQVDMTKAERLLLFSLILGLRPRRYLEIGTLYGGSATVVCMAMNCLGNDGRLFLVDPDPQIAHAFREVLAARSVFITGASPDCLNQARAASDDPFDFVLIDGTKDYKHVLADAEGVFPFLADDACILFHDVFVEGGIHAVDDFVLNHDEQLIDCGTLVYESVIRHPVDALPIYWNGFRMVRFNRELRRNIQYPRLFNAKIIGE